MHNSYIQYINESLYDFSLTLATLPSLVLVSCSAGWSGMASWSIALVWMAPSVDCLV